MEGKLLRRFAFVLFNCNQPCLSRLCGLVAAASIWRMQGCCLEQLYRFGRAFFAWPRRTVTRCLINNDLSGQILGFFFLLWRCIIGSVFFVNTQGFDQIFIDTYGHLSYFDSDSCGFVGLGIPIAPKKDHYCYHWLLQPSRLMPSSCIAPL